MTKWRNRRCHPLNVLAQIPSAATCTLTLTLIQFCARFASLWTAAKSQCHTLIPVETIFFFLYFACQRKCSYAINSHILSLTRQSAHSTSARFVLCLPVSFCASAQNYDIVCERVLASDERFQLLERAHSPSVQCRMADIVCWFLFLFSGTVRARCANQNIKYACVCFCNGNSFSRSFLVSMLCFGVSANACASRSHSHIYFGSSISFPFFSFLFYFFRRRRVYGLFFSCYLSGDQRSMFFIQQTVAVECTSRTRIILI